VETVRELAQRYEPDSPLCRAGWHEDYWTFADLSGFVAQLGTVMRACVRSPDDYERVARECFEDLAAQNVVYAEVSFGLRSPDRPHFVPSADVFAAIDRARRDVESRTALRVGLILGLGRHHYAPDDAEGAALYRAWVKEALAARERGMPFVGVDLHGDEQADQIIEAFRIAAAGGLGLRAHAGEGAGAASVWDCLRRLGVQRIAHGVRSVEDPVLVAHLAGAGIPLDMCPTSNVRTGAAASPAAHPIGALRDAGVPVSVSSDDPLVFATSITSELALLHEHAGFTAADLAHTMITAARCSFLPAAERATLARTIAAAWSGDA
jgi:adenosine deaminase